MSSVGVKPLMYAGMRMGELLALEWKDVDFDNSTITINKNVVSIKDNGSYKLLKQSDTKKHIQAAE